MSKRKDNDWQSTRTKLVFENEIWTLVPIETSDPDATVEVMQQNSTTSEDNAVTFYNLGKLAVKYCQSWTATAASAKSPADVESIDAKLIKETTKIGQELESFLIEYLFSLTDLDFESLDYEKKTKVELAANSAIFSASYTEPDVNHMMNEVGFTKEVSTNFSYGHMVFQMFMENFPFEIEIDDTKMAQELNSYVL